MKKGNEIDGRYFENGGEINDLHHFQQRKKGARYFAFWLKSRQASL